MHTRKPITYNKPMSLQECCLHYICENLDELCQVIKQPHSINLKLAFKNSDVFFNEKISEDFLKTLSEQGKLNDLALSLFDSNCMHLKRVWIKDAQLSPFGLKILKTQKIIELEITGLKNVTVNDVLGSLGMWTLSNLRTLHVSNLKSVRSSVPNCLNTTNVAVNISCLRRLKCLNVSNTKFNMQGLEIIAEELPCLEMLDISGTSINDISPLRKCKDRLKYLSLYQLKIYTDIVPVLCELTELVYLDVSYDWYSDTESRINFDRFKFKVSNLLSRTHCLPNLSSLDISGNEGLDEQLLMEFLRSHSCIRFIGLALTPACSYSCILGDREFENLTVTGEANEKQIQECFRRYINRPDYMHFTLCALFNFTSSMSLPREDILKLILLAMKQNPDHKGVQELSLSCLFNLLNPELGTNVHPSCLKEIINRTLQAMANIIRDQKIHKRAVNILYVLCKKGFLEDMISDINNAAFLVMECLCSFDDSGVTFRCMFLLAKLTAKISTDLGANRRYVQKVFQIVEKSIENRQIELFREDLLLMFGNLTGISYVACQVFVSEGCLELFLKIFQTANEIARCEQAAVEYLLLETLFNIVCVEEVHPSIMCRDLLLVLKHLMQQESKFVKFMAATVVAQLASKGENKRFIEDTKTRILDHLKHLALSWKQPEEQIIYCSSLKTFFPLLNCIDTPAVQLWTLRVIEHICIKNGRLYCRMLEDEGGTTILRKLAEDSQTNVYAARIIKAILQMVEQNIQ